MAIEVLVPVVFGVLFFLLVLGAHLGLAMSAVAIFGTSMIIGLDGALSLAGLSVYESAQSFDLSVIPLFVLMGTFASKSGISADLFAAFNTWLHRRRGGLAHASIAACAAFGAVCGSSLATAATMGQVAIPEMRRFGYSGKLATGSIAAGGTIGILIPPSVIMLIYGILTETSIGDLFLAGIVPGILLTLFFMITVVIVTRFDPDSAPAIIETPTDTPRASAFSKVWPTLLLFFLVIGGIYSGVFTPTEAAGFGAVGALLIGACMKRLNWRTIGESLMDTVQTTSMIFLILIGAILFFLDTMAMIILSIPIFFPIVMDMGFDPVWFGVLVVLVVELALITPPMGINVFVIKGMSKDVPLSHVFIGVLPFCIALLTMIALVIAVPELATFFV